MNITYRSWLKSVTGRENDEISLPENVETISDLAAFLGSRYESAAAVFELPEALRYVVDRRYVDPSHKIAGVEAIEIYPPVTGG